MSDAPSRATRLGSLSADAGELESPATETIGISAGR